MNFVPQIRGPAPIHIVLLNLDAPACEAIEQVFDSEPDGQIHFSRLYSLSEATDLCRSWQIDAIVANLDLHVESELKALEELTHQHGHPAIIVYCDVDEIPLMQRAARLGAQEYLVREQVKAECLMVLILGAIERQNLLKQLLQHEDLIVSISQQLPAIIWTTDINLIFASSFGRGLEYQGLLPGEVVGISIYEFLQSKDEDHPVIQHARGALKGHMGVGELSFKTRSYRYYIHPLRDPSGKIIGTIGLALDISDQRQAEMQLAEAEGRFKRLVEQLPAITYEVGLEFEEDAIYVSPQVEEILGYPRKEWRQGPRLWIRCIHEEDAVQVEKQARLMMKEGVPFDVEYRVYAKDGHLVWFHDRANPVRNAEGEILSFQGIMLNISKRKVAEEAYHSQREQLEQDQRMQAVGRLAGGIAHDFNNILTSILGFAYFLAEDEGMTPEQRDYAQEIITSGDRAAALVRQLLEFSRKGITVKKAFSVNLSLNKMKDMLQHILGPENHLILRPHADRSGILADPSQLEQILLNLVSNARDAIPEGGTVEISTSNQRINELEAHGSTLAAGDYLVITVSDNGSGIDQSIRDRIFNPFFTTKEVGKGTGLGLSIVYSNVDQQNGHIALASETDQGTTFTLHFPRVDLTPLPETEEEPLPLPRGSETIVVVEDDESVRILTVRFLESLGYHVVATDSPGEAIVKVERMEKEGQAAHVVLTDVALPHMSGFRLVERLREIQPHFEVLYTSGYAKESFRREGVGLVDFNFIQKPFRQEQLAWAVRYILEHGPSRNQV